MNIDDVFNKFDDISYVHDWAKLYNEYFIRRNNNLNMVFARILKMTNTEEIEELLAKSSINYEDINYNYSQQHVKYWDWWCTDCKSAYLTDGTKPVDWMKKRLLQSSLGAVFFEERESKRLKKEADKIPSGKMVKAGIVNENAGYVYVIRDMDSGLYKIGETSNWRRRFKELKVDDVKIVVIQLKWVSNRFEIEKYHHDLHRDYRLPQSEWFKLSKSPMI